jgi:hypothetical protein
MNATMNLEEAKAKLERVTRDEHAQYTAAFKLALLIVLDHLKALEEENRDHKSEHCKISLLNPNEREDHE